MKKDDAEGRAKARRHQNLLQDFLELQKEFVMKKKRCESLKNRRETLVAEVRFLRKRYQQLLQIRAANKDLLDLNTFPSSSSLIQDSVYRANEQLPTLNNQLRASEQLVGKTYLSTDLHPLLASVITKNRGQPAPQDSSLLPPKKKAKTCATNEKRTAKKKNVTWLDQCQ